MARKTNSISDMIGTKIHVMGVDYEIHPLPEGKRKKFYGQCLDKERRVLLDDRLEGFDAQDTLMHELVHSLDNVLHLELGEATVHRLGFALAHLLRDNPHLADFMKKK